MAFGNHVPFLLSPRGEEGTLLSLSKGRQRWEGEGELPPPRLLQETTRKLRAPLTLPRLRRGSLPPRWGAGISALRSNAIALLPPGAGRPATGAWRQSADERW